MTLESRYAAWCEREDEFGGERTDTFALRGDGRLVCLEEDGRYFLIVNTGEGVTPDEGRPTESLYALQDPVTREVKVAYIEPIWVAGYLDSVMGR